MNPRLVAVEGDAPELIPFPPDVLGDAPLDEERPPALEVCEGRRDGLMEGGSRLTVPVGIAPPAALEETVMPVMVLFAGGVTDDTTPPVPVTDGTTEGTTEGTTDGVTEGSGLGAVSVGGNVQTVPRGQQPGIPSTELQNSVSSQHPPAPTPVQHTLVTGQQNPTGSTHAAKPNCEHVWRLSKPLRLFSRGTLCGRRYAYLISKVFSSGWASGDEYARAESVRTRGARNCMAEGEW